MTEEVDVLGNQHRLLNDRLHELGYPTQRLERFVRAGFRVRDRLLPDTANLAATAALEHFTATLAEDGGETVTGKGSISGDILELSTRPGVPPMALQRSTAAEWKRRMDALNGLDSDGNSSPDDNK